MSTIGPNFPEGTVVLFTWLAEKAWGGAKRAFNWGWDQAKWNLAQDAYDAAIIEQYGQIRIFGQATPKSLRDIFTDVYVLDKLSADRRFSAKDLSDHLWNEDRGLSFRREEAQPGEQVLTQGAKFYILGKPGAGKTTFLKRLAVREAQRGRWGACLGKVPIFVSLKQFAEAGKSLFDFIVDQFAVCHFPAADPFIRGLLESGQALVLFDGLDEVANLEDPQSNQRGQVAEMLERFARQYSGCHVVVTCRIAAADYTFGPEFTYLEMSDFSPAQVASYVRSWFRDDGEPGQSTGLADAMLAELERPEHGGMRDLARSPLLLTLLCLNYDETRSFPARRVEIYEEALDALLKKWDSSRNIRRGGLYRSVSLGRKRQMFAEIAYKAFARGEILFRQADLEEQINAYLRDVPEIPASIDAEAVLKEIVAQHGIFAEQARGLFSFAHLTFQEYYAASHIAGASTPDVRKLLLTHIDDRRWQEAFLLLASMLPNGAAFLAAYERALHALAAQSSDLCMYLHQIDKLAQSLQTSYRQPALRALLISFQTDRERTLTRDLAQALALAQALDRDLARALDNDLALAHSLASVRYLTHARTLTHALDLDRGKLEQLSVLSRDLDHRVRENYLQASSLFHKCLQLAYTPDKRGSEDRMLLPPPGFTPPAE